MTIYTELLRLGLEEERQRRDVADCSVEELVDQLVARRIELATSRQQLEPSATRAAEWTADLITHDIALIRLCQRLGIDQVLADPKAPSTERDRLIGVLAARRIETGPADPTRSADRR